MGRAGCHIFLPGENLFPNIRVHGDHFYVTWILSGNHHHNQQQHDQPKVYACYYDSYSNTSHMIPRNCDGFHFLSKPYLVFRGSHPQALVFLGKRLDNDDDEVFAYHLETHRLINVTQTPKNEKAFSVIEEHGGFFLRTETIPFHAIYTVDFPGLEAYFCLIMLGTNDVAQNLFSASSSEENLRWICLQIRDTCGMYPVISTIPPIKC